jgi:hypothetical protein
MTRLYHKTITAVSIGGREYSADADGVIEVPEDVAGQLVRGFGLIDIGSGPPPAETRMLRLRCEDIAPVPVMGAIEAPGEVAAQLIASFGLEGSFDAGFDAGIGPASEWPLEFAVSVALKLGIDVDALIMGALLNAVSAFAHSAAHDSPEPASAAPPEGDAAIAGADASEPCGLGDVDGNSTFCCQTSQLQNPIKDERNQWDKMSMCIAKTVMSRLLLVSSAIAADTQGFRGGQAPSFDPQHTIWLCGLPTFVLPHPQLSIVNCPLSIPAILQLPQTITSLAALVAHWANAPPKKAAPRRAAIGFAMAPNASVIYLLCQNIINLFEQLKRKRKNMKLSWI